MGVITVDFKESHHYWRPAEIAPKGPARKANCGAKEKAITEFFQSLKFAKVYFCKFIQQKYLLLSIRSNL